MAFMIQHSDFENISRFPYDKMLQISDFFEETVPKIARFARTIGYFQKLLLAGDSIRPVICKRWVIKTEVSKHVVTPLFFTMPRFEIQ